MSRHEKVPVSHVLFLPSPNCLQSLEARGARFVSPNQCLTFLLAVWVPARVFKSEDQPFSGRAQSHVGMQLEA